MVIFQVMHRKCGVVIPVGGRVRLTCIEIPRFNLARSEIPPRNYSYGADNPTLESMAVAGLVAANQFILKLV